MLGLDYTDKTSHGSSQMAAHWTTQAMSSSIAITIAFDLHHRGMIGIVIEHITSYAWSPILIYQVSVNFCLLPSATKLRQGNVFTPVCHSVHMGVFASVHAEIHTPWQTPLARHPPFRHSLRRHPPGQTPPQQTTTAVDGTHPTGMHSC